MAKRKKAAQLDVEAEATERDSVVRRLYGDDAPSKTYKPMEPPPVSLEDAPNDGRLYGRRNGQWVVLTMKAIMMQHPTRPADVASTNESPAAGKGSGAE